NGTLAHSPALFALETRDWEAARALKPNAAAEPYNQAITFWAQAVAAGHLHDFESAQRAVDQYDRMIEATEKGPKPYIARRMTTRGDEARAWLLLLQGKDIEATALLRKQADKQDVEGKKEIELPAREMLADMLLELKRPSEALREYEKSMTIDPSRFNGLYGAGRAAEILGDREKQRRCYQQLVDECAAHESLRSESSKPKSPHQQFRDQS
ncbi:MAG: hypothetical protein J2P13_07265, partial [Acidobacteria bacterium]|nr:hypothetical protein [Acidobacteriota bacterium]